jgi:DNA polymerase I-like protein with 3'-5' exonuclease and polymerase domains
MVTAPPDCYLVNFDLAQAESWIVAYLANEYTMKHVLATGDLHRETAQRAFANMTDEAWEKVNKDERKARRYTGKRYNHATAYRMGPVRACEVINKDSDKPPFVTVTHAESKVFYQKWHDYYHIQDWWNEIEYQLNQGRTLITPYDRVRYFFAPWGPELFREATAYVPQSTVADHFNGAVQDGVNEPGGLVEIYNQFMATGQIKIVNQSHDSCLCEIPKDSALTICPQIVKLLCRPLRVRDEEFTIPVDCEIGFRWGELVEQHRAVGSYEIEFQLPEAA